MPVYRENMKLRVEAYVYLYILTYFSFVKKLSDLHQN